MLKIWSDKKAVSPVIAALLLVAIAVAGSVVTHSWVMSMIKTQGEQAQTAIRVDLVEFPITSNIWINTTVRNVGSVQATIGTIYVSLQDGTTYTQDYTSDNVIDAGDKLEFCFGSDEHPSGFLWTVNNGYTIKILTDTGFGTEGTYYSPSS